MSNRNTILVIDDDSTDFRKTKALLESEQIFKVIPSNYTEMKKALNRKNLSVNMWSYFQTLLKEHEDDLCLIICDIKIHGRNTGLDIIEWIREGEACRMNNPLINNFIPIIAYTIYDDKTELAFSKRASLYIQKSDDEDGLLANSKRLIKDFNSILDTFNEVFWPVELRPKIQQLVSSPKKKAFLMTSFSSEYDKLVSTVKRIFEGFGVDCYIASSPGGQFDDTLFNNIQVFMLGCDFGVGLYTDDSNLNKEEKIKINPNLSLEVGYMLALKKPLCILKDKDLKKMNVDIIDRLYSEFDKDDEESLKTVIHGWLINKGYLSRE